MASKCICPVCLGNEMESGLMCAICYKLHREEAKQAILDHQPVESQLKFATRQNLDNLSELNGELTLKMGQTRVFFSGAHGEVASECRVAGLRFRKEEPEEQKEFMSLVRARYQEIMEKAGQKDLYERVEWLKARIRTGEEKARWYRRLEARQKESSEKEEDARAVA